MHFSNNVLYIVFGNTSNGAKGIILKKKWGLKENDIKGKIFATFVRHIIYQQCVSKLSIRILKKKTNFFLW
jgi:hypothetical protein